MRVTPYQILQVSNVTLKLALNRILGTGNNRDNHYLSQFDIDSIWLLVGVKQIAIYTLKHSDDPHITYTLLVTLNKAPYLLKKSK